MGAESMRMPALADWRPAQMNALGAAVEAIGPRTCRTAAWAVKVRADRIACPGLLVERSWETPIGPFPSFTFLSTALASLAASSSSLWLLRLPHPSRVINLLPLRRGRSSTSRSVSSAAADAARGEGHQEEGDAVVLH
jgi:hypothetical protein